MAKPYESKPLDEMLEEIYSEIPSYEITEDDIDGMYRQYEDFLKKDEFNNLDLDYDQG